MPRNGWVVLHATAFFLRSTLRNHAALVLTGVIIGLMLLAVGTRLPITRQGAGAFSRIHALIEDPSLQQVSAEGTEFLTVTPIPRGAVAGSVLFSNEGTRNDIATSDLSGVMLFALPLAALLIGVGMSPHRGGVAFTISSAPIRRVTLYVAHTLALLGYLIAVLAIGWGLCALLLLATRPGEPSVQRQLFSTFAYSGIFASIFGFLGLWFGVWFKHRSAAILAGVSIVIILVGVLPNLGEFLTESYFDAHPALVQPTRDTGIWPDDPLFRVILAVRHTPGNAMQRVLREVANPTPTTMDRTCNCRLAWSSAKIIGEETIAMGAAMVVAFLLGAVTFARQEVSES